jgi:alpha-beta hydrolase superfamily lysophospholipase
MNTQKLVIEGIPAMLWGDSSAALFIAVHGNQSNKADVPIRLLAEHAVQRGWQVLSFDLPEHGERMQESSSCMVEQCVRELGILLAYAKQHWQTFSLFANSMGAYFSLVAFSQMTFTQVLFLSPVVDMHRLIDSVMQAFQISEEWLQEKQRIETPVGMTLSWPYYFYVKEHPITVWKSPTAILYGDVDEVCERTTIDAFCSRYGASLRVVPACPHYVHTPEQLAYLINWLDERVTDPNRR